MCSSSVCAVAGVPLDHGELRGRQRAGLGRGSCPAPAACRCRAAAPRRPGRAGARRADRAPARPRLRAARRGACARASRRPWSPRRASRRATQAPSSSSCSVTTSRTSICGVQRARGRGACEVAHERGRDDEEGAQLEHVPAPEADRPDRAEQVGGDCDGEPHEPGRHGQVAEAARELERPQCAQREHAVDQRVRADDPPDERAQGDRDARDRSGHRAARALRTRARPPRRRSAAPRGRARTRARAVARAMPPASPRRRAAPRARRRRRPRPCTRPRSGSRASSGRAPRAARP